VAEKSAPQTAAELRDVTLETLGKGAANELFTAELRRVVENVMDPNAPAKTKRVINLKFTFAPSEDRRSCGVGIEATSKIAAPNGGSAVIYVGKRMGEAVASIYDAEQMQLDYDKQSRPTPVLKTGTGK
jgi:hypothetical protein